MNILQLLNSPVPVAWFQHFCGVRWKQYDYEKPLYPSKKALTNKLKTDDNERKSEFVISNQILFFLAKAGTELAGEPFYYIFFPACSWLFPITIARRTLLMLTTSMFIGQCLKDIIKQPRPASPPVIRLESMYETEYGMPSTHVVAAVASSFSMLVFSSEICQISWNTGLKVALMWSSCVIISRIYLGMHTILEVAAGTSLALSLVHTSKPAIEWFDEQHLSSGHMTSVCVGLSGLLMARFMFSLDNSLDQKTGKRRWNTARGDLAEILGWCAGFLIGSKYAIDHGILSTNINLEDGIMNWGEDAYPALLRCSIRFLSGALILFPVNILTRKGLFHCFAYAHGFNGSNFDIAQRTREVELPYKFFSSVVSALMSTFLIPGVLQHFDLW